MNWYHLNSYHQLRKLFTNKIIFKLTSALFLVTCFAIERLLSVVDFPSSFLGCSTELSGSFSLSSPLLVHKYDLSQHFPTDSRFKGLLLSPSGVQSHRKICLVKSQNCYENQLFIGLGNECFTAWKTNGSPRLPQLMEITLVSFLNWWFLLRDL